MRMISPTELTIDQLCMSPNNCRTQEPTADDTAPLEALILQEGLRHPIEVHPLRGPKPSLAKHGAFAGRRRYYSIKRLIARGDLPANWPIKVTVYAGFSDAELIEKSISENFRQDLSDTELFAGIARAHRKGHDVDQIARNLGNLDAQLVAGWLRLGTLAQPILDALVAGEIDLPRAKAYAATADRDLQAEVFAKLRRPEGLVHPVPVDIRRALKVGDRELERHLLFVGADAYRAAGGRYELDLFAEDVEQRGRVVDEGVLFKLVGERLSFIRDHARANTGRPTLQFRLEPPKNNIGGTDYTLQHRAQAGDDGTLFLPDGVEAHIAITDVGEPELTYWWPTTAAKHGTTRQAPAAKPGRTLSQIFGRPVEGAAISTSEMAGGGEARRVANTALRDEAGLTADTIEILRSQRRMILRARMIDAVDRPGDDIVAADFLVWSQLRLHLTRGTISTVGAAHLHGASGDPEVTREHLKPMPAQAIWSGALRELQEQSFLTDANLGNAFLDYRASADRLKGLATAVVAGLALERSLDADGYRIGVHDALAHQLELDADTAVRRYWTPTAELLARIPKEQRAAIAQPFVETATFAPWSRLKDPELTTNVLQVVTGLHPATRPAVADEAADWVHPQLRFRAIGADGSPDNVAALESAGL